MLSKKYMRVDFPRVLLIISGTDMVSNVNFLMYAAKYLNIDVYFTIRCMCKEKYLV